MNSVGLNRNAQECCAPKDGFEAVVSNSWNKALAYGTIPSKRFSTKGRSSALCGKHVEGVSFEHTKITAMKHEGSKERSRPKISHLELNPAFIFLLVLF